MLDKGPSEKATVTKDEAENLFLEMTTIRRMELASSNLYKNKTIRGFCHLYSGQEAIAVGMRAAMRPQDKVITAYRCHGWCYLCGVSPIGVIAELTGRELGCARGKGGSMHMYSPKFFGGNGIVGAQVPLGAGISLACQMLGEKAVCFTMYGDGAANQGQIFEAYNMAFLWKLPCIFVCENNQYGMGTSAKRASMNTDYYTRGDSIPGIWADGMDVLAMKNAAAFAIEHAINCGPIVIEAHTYRYFGHSMSDPGTSYRSRDEIDDVRKKSDPIATFKERMISSGLLTGDSAKKIEDKIKKEIDGATDQATKAKEIGLNELSADVYMNCLEPAIRGSLSYNLKHERIGKPHKKMGQA